MKKLTDEQYAERFWAKVETTGFCWLWRGACDGDGYGQLSFKRRHHRAHRVAYELLMGPIPEGLQLDHLCRVRNCVNPDHLEPVTSAENHARRKRDRTVMSPEQQRKLLGLCRSGHVLTEVGVLKSTKVNSKGERVVRERCRACQHETQERNRQRNGIKPRGKRGSYGPRKGDAKASTTNNILNLHRDTLRTYHEAHPEPLTRRMVA